MTTINLKTKAPKLSTRTIRAIEELRQPGTYMRNFLERNYHGIEQFKARIVRNGRAVPGFGHAVFTEMQARGLLVIDAQYTGGIYYRLRGI